MCVCKLFICVCMSVSVYVRVCACVCIQYAVLYTVCTTVAYVVNVNLLSYHFTMLVCQCEVMKSDCTRNHMPTQLIDNEQ